MAVPVFEMFGRLSLDKTEYDQGMNSAEKASSSFASKLSKGLGTAGKVIATGITAATAAVGKLTQMSLSGYANYEQLTGGVETLFKDSAAKVMEYANIAYKTAGLSANEYMETTTSFAASLLQSLGGDTKAAADVANRAVIDMADNANKMGTDMSAIQNAYMGFSKQNYTMLDNLKLGYGGTKTEMERLIADAAKMTDVQRELGITVDASSMSFGNIVNAISVMQTHLGIAGTTALEASTTISGSVASMKSAWSNLLVGLADDTQDMGVLIDNFVESAITAINNIVPRIQVILGGIGELVARMVGVIGEQLPAFISSLVPPLLQAATGLFSALASAIPMLLEVIIAQFPYIIETIVAIIPMLVTALLQLLPSLLDVAAQAVVTIIEGLTSAIPQIIPVAVDIITALIDGLISALPSILSAGLELVMALAEGIVAAIPRLVAKLPQIITAIVNFLMNSISKIADTGMKLLSALVKALPSIIQTIVAVLPQIITAIINYYMSAIPLIVETGIKLLVSLIKALPTIITTIVGAIPQIINGIVGALSNNIPAIIQAGFQLFVAIIENLPGIIAAIVSAVPQIVSGIVSAFASKVSAMWNVGKSLVQGIWQGISNSVSWIKEKITGWVGNVLGFIKGLFGIHSPSTVMRDQVGLMLGRGVAEGIMDSIGDVESASDRLLGAIPNLEGRDFSLNVKRTMADSYSGSMEVFTRRMEEIMAQFQQTIILQMDEREFGRAVRGYA